uniref:Uncharacterized protein n=1 Tax=Populus alba TaxID=43335 RepID=A0A4U5PM51_POPAL|nr:hypothetical protein D5086_0000205670 [Populus alba]
MHRDEKSLPSAGTKLVLEDEAGGWCRPGWNWSHGWAAVSVNTYSYGKKVAPLEEKKLEMERSDKGVLVEMVATVVGLGGGWSEATLTKRAASSVREELAKRGEWPEGGLVLGALSLSPVLVRKKWK